MSTSFQVKTFLRHWLTTVDEHSIHSPFFFDFYQRVVVDRTPAPTAPAVEALRKKLLANDTVVNYQEVGSQSKHLTGTSRTLRDIAATSLMPARWAQLLYRIACYAEAKKIVELGTSMGLSTLYLAQAPKTHVFTFEGNAAMINVALTHFEAFDVRNITLVEGNINQTLSDHLQNPAKVQLAVVDANHRYEPTLHYFELLCKRMADKGIMVIDDIHQSPDMERAWKYMKSHELVYGSVDLYRMGILFFDLSLNKQHYIWTL